MSGVYEEAKEAAISGGLTAMEARNQAQIDYPPEEPISIEEVPIHELPALGAALEKEYRDTESATPEINSADEYVDYICSNIGNFFTPIERVTESASHEKEAEYAFRTLYTLSEDVKPETISTSLEDLLDNSCAADVVSAQYLDKVNEIVDEDLIQRVYDEISGNPTAEILALANAPTDDLPETFRSQEHHYSSEYKLEDRNIVTRLRSMKGAGECDLLEPGHKDTVLEKSDENPEQFKQNTLIALDSEIVGSVKHVGNTSMLALRDVENNGRFVMKKGWTYRIPARLSNNLKNTPEVEEWSILETDRLEVRPMRPAGEKGEDFSEAEFRELIDERMEEFQRLI